jgi:septal ring factor EnvC (AmiA/AmiB activator)
MYIFSASTYFEALKRNKYLEKIAEIQKKQKLIILQHQGLITNEKKSLETEKERKIRVAEEKRKEKEAMLKDKVIQLKTLNKLKGEESVLMANLKKEENKKAILKQKIKEAIDAEIAAAEKARKEKERKEKKAEEAKNAKKTSSSGSSTTTTPKEVEKKTVTISETKELALNKGFENNKGRLLWPVASGSITEGYGKHAHPTLPNVTTNNNGIDISAPKSAQVRAVYEGEVTSVLSIPGAGKVVIIKHGNYRTVYSNLQESYVSVGSKVNTKQSIGSLLAIEGESLSVAHFEIHLVEEGQVIRINPSLWIAH